MRHRIAPIAASLAVLALLAGDALAKKPSNPGKPDKPGKPDRSTFGKARSPLVHAPGGSDDNAKGRIDIQRRRNGSDLRIRGQRLDGNSDVDILIKRLGDDPATLDVVETDFVVESEVLADGLGTNDEGSVKITLRTHKSDALPLGATSLDELAGLRVCIREAALDDDGADLLVGTVPLIGADLPKRVKERAVLDPVDEGDSCAGKVRIGFRGKDVRSELRIDVKGLDENDVVSFRMDDGSGQMVEIGSATADSDGDARYRVRTNHGDPLPLGAATVLDLRGRALEVWVNAALVDTTPDVADDPLVEVGLCLTGTVPGGE